MYHRMIGEDESKHTARDIAEKLRKMLSRAVILFLILWAAPMLYEALTDGSLDHLAGANASALADIQFGITVATIFTIAGLVIVARVEGRPHV